MKAMPKAMIISGLIVGAIFMFLLGSFVPGVGGLIQGLFMLAAILFGAMVPVLAASLMLAVKAIYDEAVPFNASYLMMSIVLACTAGFMIVTIRLGYEPVIRLLGAVPGGGIRDWTLHRDRRGVDRHRKGRGNLHHQHGHFLCDLVFRWCRHFDRIGGW